MITDSMFLSLHCLPSPSSLIYEPKNLRLRGAQSSSRSDNPQRNFRAYSEAELESIPTQWNLKRHLDHDDQPRPYIPGTTSAQRHVTDKTPKKRKTASSLPSYVKLNVIRDAVIVHGAPTEDGRPKCLISSVSDKMTVLEFFHVMSVSTPSKEVIEIFFLGPT